MRIRLQPRSRLYGNRLPGCFGNDEGAISNLLDEKNHLHEACVDRPTDDNRAAIYRSRRPRSTATARDAGRLDGSQGRGDPRVREPQRMEELLLRDQRCLRFANQWHCSSPQHRRAVGRAHPRRPQPPSTISDAAIARPPQVKTNADLDLPPSLHETIGAVQQLSRGKASGSGAITAGVYKHGGPQLMDHLTALSQEMWRQGEVLQNFKDATIVHLYKRKGNRRLCGNHRGISLLNVAGKIIVHVLLKRLNNYLEQGLLSENQCGFRRHRETTDMIFAARQLQEKCQEMRTHL
ncbi:hypothetical protein SprV_0301077900 [Sparganum proliferum]